METTEVKIKKAILVGIYSRSNEKKRCEKSLEELESLAFTNGIQVVGKAMQELDKPNSKFFVGKGKAEEIAQMVSSLEANLVIFDDEITSLQVNVLEQLFGVEVIDRTNVILEIFAKHATTKEGILQVEIASMRYKLTHPKTKGVEMSRLGAGIGTRGPGETKLEVTKRVIRDRIHKLKKELKSIDKTKELLRKSKNRQKYKIVCIVGYTNAGKSTLLNTLTNENILAKDMLFATLDSTARLLTLPEGTKVVLIDTIGFINKLPHDLVSAFKSTLDDVRYSDYLVHVVDVSDSDCQFKSEVVYKTLDDILPESKEVITLKNKCDSEIIYKLADERSIASFDISAKDGNNLDEFLKLLESKIRDSKVKFVMNIPYEKGELIAKIREYGEIVAEQYLNDNTEVTCFLERKYIGILGLSPYIKDYE